MPTEAPDQDQWSSSSTAAFYRHVLGTLAGAGVPYLVGGAYAQIHYSGLVRDTKDVDILVRPRDRERAFAELTSAGYRIEGIFHWIGKVYRDEDCVDVINSGMSGVATVDDSWFEHAVETEMLGLQVKLCAPEELIWTKAYVMERERFDGADMAHLLRACVGSLDWRRLLDRFGAHWRVLLSHLILFGFIYPQQRTEIPTWVMDELLRRVQGETSSPAPTEHLCQGTLLSWRQYLTDTERWGYHDARLVQGYMTAEEIERWTEAFRDN